MSDKFNISRFGQYFVYELKSHWKNLGLMTGIFALFPIILYIAWKFLGTVFNRNFIELFTMGFPEINGPSLGLRFGLFAAMVIIFTMIYPAKAYGDITNKAEGSQWLMLPASRLEKFLSMAINTLVIIPLAFFLVYFISDALVCLIDKSCGIPMISFSLNSNLGLLGDDPVVPRISWFLLLLHSMLIYASAFLLGAIIFKRTKAFKTLGCVFLINTVIGTITSFLGFTYIDNMNPDRIEAWAKLDLTPWLLDNIDRVDMIINTLINAGLVFWLALLWGLVWLRLKKLQH